MNIFVYETLKEFFPAPLMPAIRQPSNLRRILHGSKLHPITRFKTPAIASTTNRPFSDSM